MRIVCCEPRYLAMAKKRNWGSGADATCVLDTLLDSVFLLLQGVDHSSGVEISCRSACFQLWPSWSLFQI
jgi:hypothetical protein